MGEAIADYYHEITLRSGHCAVIVENRTTHGAILYEFLSSMHFRSCLERAASQYGHISQYAESCRSFVSFKTALEQAERMR